MGEPSSSQGQAFQVNQLPENVQQLIISYIPQQELGNARLVCRTWYTLSTNKVEYLMPWYVNSRCNIEQIFPKLQVLDLAGRRGSDLDFRKRISLQLFTKGRLKHLKNLKKLRIGCDVLYTSAPEDATVNRHGLWVHPNGTIVRSQNLLTANNFVSFTQLESLELQNGQILDIQQFQKLSCLTNLSLDMVTFQSPNKLTTLLACAPLSNEATEDTIHSNQRGEAQNQLYGHQNTRQSEQELQRQENFVQNTNPEASFPKLERLQITGYQHNFLHSVQFKLDNTLMNCLLAHTRLTHLNIEGVSCDSNLQVQALQQLSQLTKLQSIYLPRRYEWQKPQLMFLTKLPSLAELHVRQVDLNAQSVITRHLTQLTSLLLVLRIADVVGHIMHASAQPQHRSNIPTGMPSTRETSRQSNSTLMTADDPAGQGPRLSASSRADQSARDQFTVASAGSSGSTNTAGPSNGLVVGDYSTVNNGGQRAIPNDGDLQGLSGSHQQDISEQQALSQHEETIVGSSGDGQVTQLGNINSYRHGVPLQTTLDPSALPLQENGSVDEHLPGTDNVTLADLQAQQASTRPITQDQQSDRQASDVLVDIASSQWAEGGAAVPMQVRWSLGTLCTLRQLTSLSLPSGLISSTDVHYLSDMPNLVVLNISVLLSDMDQGQSGGTVDEHGNGRFAINNRTVLAEIVPRRGCNQNDYQERGEILTTSIACQEAEEDDHIADAFVEQHSHLMKVLATLPQLQRLDLYICTQIIILSSINLSFQPLEACSKLDSLGLRLPTGALFVTLPTFPKLTDLQVLQKDGQSLHVVGINQQQCVRNLRVSSGAMQCSVGVAPYNNLRHLHRLELRIHPQDSYLQQLSHENLQSLSPQYHTNLQHLRLNQCSINDAVLCSVSQLTTLRSIVINQPVCTFTEVGLSALSQLRNLRVLVITFWGFRAARRWGTQSPRLIIDDWSFIGDWERKLTKLIQLHIEVFSELSPDSCEQIFAEKAQQLNTNINNRLFGRL